LFFRLQKQFSDSFGVQLFDKKELELLEQKIANQERYKKKPKVCVLAINELSDDYKKDENVVKNLMNKSKDFRKTIIITGKQV
jgi:hypothetical protein